MTSAVPDAAPEAGASPAPGPSAAGVVGLPAKPRWRGRLHRAAFFTALGLAPGLVAAAGSATARMAVGVYALCLLGLFGISALFHCVDWGPGAHAFMRRLDHSMIFVFIAGTYTPIAVLTVDSPARELMLVAVWAAAVLGVAVQVFWIDAPRQLTAGLYVAVGWIAVLAIPALIQGLGPAGFALLVAGGIAYTMGAVVYARKRPDPIPDVFGFHEVFHALVILAACFHLTVVAFFALPKSMG